MPRFAPITALLGETLDLPVPDKDGQVKIYKVKPCSAEVGLYLTARFQAIRDRAAASGDDDEEVADDKSEVDVHRMALGDTYDEMMAGGVLFDALRLVGWTAVIWHAVGENAAQRYWESGGDPKPQGASTSKTASRATPAAGRSTRKPASASGTTRSRKAPPPAGETSSPSGTS